MRLTGACALIPAAGRGARFGGAENKVFAPLLGRPLLGWTLQAFADCDAIDDIVLIGAPNDLPRLREIGEAYGGGKVIAVISGGASRQESVRNGLRALCDPALSIVGDAEYVLIHDAARCCVTPNIIRTVVAATRMEGAATAAIPIADTLVRDDGVNIDRSALWAVQTPQGFDRIWITMAHDAALAKNWEATDDAAISGQHGQRALLVMGSPENLKVTHPEDLAIAEAILARRQNAASPVFPAIRVGHGYDVHPFADGRPLFLGGVAFPEAARGLLGHSDADVLLHALCDALLGAAGMGDIGVLFPPSDMRHKDRASIEFLAEVKARLDLAGWRIANVDATILAEAPKIGPRAAEMKAVIARTLGIATDQVGIKATTNEGLGFVGRGEGIAAHAAALLTRP